MNLAEAFLEEQKRVRTILGYYHVIGPAGAFGAAMIQDLLTRAERAAMTQDVVDMLSIYHEMKAVKE